MPKIRRIGCSVKALGLATLFLFGVSAGVGAAAGVRLGELTWPEARRALACMPLVVVPFAAGAKEHGPHLPMNTDQRVMEHLLEAALAETDALIAPPILHGWFPAFRAFPGTEVADPAVFQNYVRAVAQSLTRQGAQRIVLLNLGIARATGLPLAVVARDLRADLGVPTLLVNWDDLETAAVAAFTDQPRGGHADEIETSIVLALEPDAVRQDQIVADLRGPRSPQVGYAPGYFEAEESGLYGDPTLASAEKGRRTLAIMRSRWLLALQQFARRPVASVPECPQENHHE